MSLRRFGPYPDRDIPADQVEDVPARTSTSKTFVLPDGKRRIVKALSHIHFRDGTNALQDIVLQWSDTDPTMWECKTNMYEAQASKALIQMRYKDGVGFVRQRLTLIGTDPAPAIAPNPAVMVGVRDVVWVDVVAGLDIVVRMLPGRLIVFHRCKSDAAPRQFKWRLEERNRQNFRSTPRINQDVFEYDNELKTPRPSPEQNKPRRLLEMERSHTGQQDPNPDERNYDYNLRWTGKTYRVDSLRDRTLVTDKIYPVIFG